MNTKNTGSKSKWAKGSVVIQVTKRTADIIAPEMNLRNPPSVGDDAHRQGNLLLV